MIDRTTKKPANGIDLWRVAVVLYDLIDPEINDDIAERITPGECVYCYDSYGNLGHAYFTRDDKDRLIIVPKTEVQS